MNGLFKSTKMQSARAPSSMIPTFSPKARAPLRVAAVKMSLSNPAKASLSLPLADERKEFHFLKHTQIVVRGGTICSQSDVVGKFAVKFMERGKDRILISD